MERPGLTASKARDGGNLAVEWQTLALGIVAGLILAPLLLLLALKVFVWFLKRKLSHWMESLGGSAQVPLDITLLPLDSVQWDNPQVESHGLDFQQQGMASVGAFSIAEMPGVRLTAWHHPDKNLFGVVYEHSQAGVWCDLVSRYANGTSCTHTTAPESGLDPNPDHPNHRIGSTCPKQLMQVHLQDRPPDALAHGPEEFVQLFQEAYRRDRQWRLARGTRRHEIVQVAALSGKNYDSSVLDQAYHTQMAQERAELHSLLRRKFLEKTQLSAAEWDQVQDRLVFIHDQLEPEELEELHFLDDSSGGPPRQRARQSQARYLGSLTEPLEVDVYELPEELDS